jgi:8-oxo-dGTP pyrophosphatase MutT (NUDIX family)
MDIPRGVGVLVLEGTKVLVATRTDNGTICGPGGHVKLGEDLQEAAIRETREEFGINVHDLEILGELLSMPEEYCNTTVFLCTQYDGIPIADGIEQVSPRFVELKELLESTELYVPFKESLLLLQQKNVSISTCFKVAKVKEDEGLVSGWANVAVQPDGSLPLDWQDDTIRPETLEKAAINFMMDYRGSGEMHQGEGKGKGIVVESIVFTKEKQKAIGIPEGCVPEGWFITVKVTDPEVFAAVKAGVYRMFSIQGRAKRIKL